jgi:hypothetical protein
MWRRLRQFLSDGGVYDSGRRVIEKRVAVRISLDDRVGPNRPAGAAQILHDDLLAHDIA